MRIDLEDGKRSREGNEEDLFGQRNEKTRERGGRNGEGSRRRLMTVLEQVHCPGRMCPPQQAETTLSSS